MNERPVPPPPGVVDLGGGRILCRGDEAVHRAGAAWLAQNYPEHSQDPPSGWHGPVFNMSGRWFNAAAVEWVLYEAPKGMAPGLVTTLAVVASFAGPDGRGAYPSAEMIAMLTRKSVKQARRDMHDLAARKLLVPGDRRAVHKLRADRRPAVWDLPGDAIEYIARRRKRGDKPSSRTGSRVDTNGESSTSTRDADGWTSEYPTGGHMRPDDSPPMSTEEFLKNSGKGAPLAPLADPERVTALVAETHARLAAKLNGRRPS